ncbi:ABC transporter permease [Sporosarcina sp. Te-1]|uniref:ABC transporter permease n=1 Tax=Sporosarcina sp. Te-1 TaxID=2818390 RepID=UPI001A9FD633|nr:ABC transporter permease [Sporosarcina sp. Te-1]QTD42079.1 ABC transporter permease [Sporosarcina sp. Te-1]
MRFIKIAVFDFRNIIRNPTLLFSNMVLPLILIGLMGFVTQSFFGSSLMSSYDYYGITMITLSALLIIMTATNAFMEEQVKKANIRMIYAPIAKAEIYLSKILSTFLIGTLSFSFILLIGQYVFQINFGGDHLPYIVILISMLALFGSCFGTMMCCVFGDEEKASSISQLPVLLFSAFGGIFFSTYGLGKTVALLSNLSPVKWIVECAFRIIYDNDLTLLMPVTITLLGASVVCVLVCQLTFKPEEFTC